jgi:hypothetical protein
MKLAVVSLYVMGVMYFGSHAVASYITALIAVNLNK